MSITVHPDSPKHSKERSAICAFIQTMHGWMDGYINRGVEQEEGEKGEGIKKGSQQ